ncbi:unnamed protein product [Bursaphelenchus xylophilus]|uniref:(pine wood nematode) hypothetical protein n=1 Tax=Bursaphelenchus xylophilus TaxID=6326 RepID=A0A1I7S7R9_BURXY|nr:unnamed protein product [Bursaphelenchus xylophilus]CAG9086906.1 unnamed protein product [Bursaphelenchus xylophilus]
MRKRPSTPLKPKGETKEPAAKGNKKQDQAPTKDSTGRAKTPVRKSRKKGNQTKEEAETVETVKSSEKEKDKEKGDKTEKIELPKKIVDKETKNALIKKSRRSIIQALSTKKSTTRTYMDNVKEDDASDIEVDPKNEKEKKKEDKTGGKTEIQSMYYIGDPRITFVNAFAKAGVKRLMKEFVGLRRFTPKGATTKNFEKYMNRNRYADVPCLDSTRIVLKGRQDNDDYIHANKVMVPGNNSIPYICCQGPMSETCEDFWYMVLQEKAAVIVMLCDFVEDETEKCANYYPLNTGEVGTYGILRVKNEKSSPAGLDTAVISQLEVEGIDDALSVTHLRWSDWQDHTAPLEAGTVIKLLKMAKKYSNGRPVVVHCSAGIGRTGTFVALDYVYEKLKVCAGKSTMVDVVKELRGYRMHAVQSAPQYVFLHLATMMWMFTDNPHVEKTPAHNQFIQDYSKYMKKLSQKIAKKKKT